MRDCEKSHQRLATYEAWLGLQLLMRRFEALLKRRLTYNQRMQLLGSLGIPARAACSVTTGFLRSR